MEMEELVGNGGLQSGRADWKSHLPHCCQIAGVMEPNIHGTKSVSTLSASEPAILETAEVGGDKCIIAY